MSKKLDRSWNHGTIVLIFSNPHSIFQISLTELKFFAKRTLI